MRGCGPLPQHTPVPTMRPSFSILPGTSFGEYSWPCNSVIYRMEVLSISKPLLAFLVASVHRGLLTLHFFASITSFNK